MNLSDIKTYVTNKFDISSLGYSVVMGAFVLGGFSLVLFIGPTVGAVIGAQILALTGGLATYFLKL